MAKFNDLKISQLKKELEKRAFETNGLKTELQSRLREAMEAENINVEEYVFYMELEEETTKIEEKEEAQCSSKMVDINMIFAAISQMGKEQNTRKYISDKTRLSTNLEEQFVAQDAHISAQVSLQLKEQDARISEVTSQIAEVSSQTSEERDRIKTEVDELRDHLRELQFNRPIISSASAKVKPSSFDGTVPLHVFKLQFEKTASSNNWNAEDKVAALFVALKESAAKILQIIPNCEVSSYETLMGALERRHGSEHRKQIFQIELRNRRQKANESLQEFSTEIERLAHLAYAHKSVEYIEDTKISTFVNGIRDNTTRFAALACPKLTFAETVSYALTQETASLLCHQTFKAHKVEIEEHTWVNLLLEKINNMQKALEKSTEAHKKNDGVLKCFNCGKSDHIARNFNQSNNPVGCKRNAEEDQANVKSNQSLN
ncbi:citron rho-interacting kinase-like [Bactrocera oleae]|uniref:citron rho-interacting kinase-like n=1 Tax=Bactrocera oleae TaxID=104688 RepID=UPI00387EABBB